MRRDISCATDLEDAINSYQRIGRLELLHQFANIAPSLEGGWEEHSQFYSTVLPKMQQMMLNMPNVITTAPRLLLHPINEEQSKYSAVHMTQEQCAHLVVAAFFCAVPSRDVDMENKVRPTA